MALHPIAEANQQSPFGSLTAEEFYMHHRVSHGDAFVTNPRGLRLFTQWWTPLPPTKPIGIVSIIHGFGSESSWLVQLTAVLFAKSGFATCAIDHQGHGFSDGLVAHIPDINPVVDDCIAFFDEFRSRHARDHHHRLPAFLYAESLGGAIALYIMLRQRGGGSWNGLILNGAMCGLSAKFKPFWPIEHILFILAWLLPTWRVVHTHGTTLSDVSFKEPWKRKLAMSNPRRRRAAGPPQRSWFAAGGPRLGTAYELLRVCRELQGKFEEVEVPLLIVHGGDDVVCDPACVEDLYRRAASEDKTIRVYSGMWHQLVGEPQENVDLVFRDVLGWLKDRTERAN